MTGGDCRPQSAKIRPGDQLSAIQPSLSIPAPDAGGTLGRTLYAELHGRTRQNRFGYKFVFRSFSYCPASAGWRMLRGMRNNRRYFGRNSYSASMDGVVTVHEGAGTAPRGVC
jgi:hypothetical protein